MEHAKLRTFLSQGLAATVLVGTVGTIVLLIWWNVHAAVFGYGSWASVLFGAMFLLPIALPIAWMFTVPLAILPTYLFGAGLGHILSRMDVSDRRIRIGAGAVAGGALGPFLLWRMEDSTVIGIIFGASVGGMWFAIERPFAIIFRKRSSWT